MRVVKMWHLSAGNICKACYRKAAAEKRAAKEAARAAKVAERSAVVKKQVEVKNGGEKMAGSHSRVRISDEIREKVKAEFGTMTNAALGKKYGISGQSVAVICGGLAQPPRKSGAQRPPKRPRANGGELSRSAAARFPLAADYIAGKLVTLQVPEAALDRIFASMPLAARAALIQRALTEATI